MRRRHRRNPSMEGRTIVRPNEGRPIPIDFGSNAFNGGPDDRPAKSAVKVGDRSDELAPSMEGRTIVRPNPRTPRLRQIIAAPFNGGPDDRPAKCTGPATAAAPPMPLQWRAGRSSGQMSDYYTNTRTRADPSMEGRTIVRPNFSAGDQPRAQISDLQWRAGRSSGQMWRGVGGRN